ncbi:MAG: DUF1653 domain-containing protein [Clostridiales bacterium]|nr:DUF1653 domain-containing protein [Clostridiales bacterium]
MEEIKLKKVYRHYKGNYYIVEDIAKNSETNEEYVAYRALYGNTNELWIRPLSMFLEKVDSNSPNNVTGQSYRFEYATEINKNYLF